MLSHFLLEIEDRWGQEIQSGKNNGSMETWG